MFKVYKNYVVMGTSLPYKINKKRVKKSCVVRLNEESNQPRVYVFENGCFKFDLKSDFHKYGGDDDVCAICLSEFNRSSLVGRLNCKPLFHDFHLECIKPCVFNNLKSLKPYICPFRCKINN